MQWRWQELTSILRASALLMAPRADPVYRKANQLFDRFSSGIFTADFVNQLPYFGQHGDCGSLTALPLSTLAGRVFPFVSGYFVEMHDAKQLTLCC